MIYIYSALLLHSLKKEINENNIKKIIESVGEKPDETRIKALVASLEGKDIDSIIAKAAMPVATAPVEAKAEKKEEKKEEDIEKKAEAAVEGLAGLFG